MPDVYDHIDIDDLTEDLQLIAEICGMEAIRNLLRHYSGLNIYVPKISRLDRFILKYIGKNRSRPIKQLALELKISEHHLRNLLKK